MGLKKVERPNYFWDDENFKIIPHKGTKRSHKKLKKAFSKAIVVVLLLLALVSFVIVRAYYAKSHIEKLSKNAKKHLSETFVALSDGDIDTALSSAEKSSSEIKELRLNLQSWGQDDSSINYLSLKKSKYSNLEQLLRAADYTLTSITDLRKALGAQFADAISVSNKENAPMGEIAINFNQSELDKIFSSTDQKFSNSLNILDEIGPGVETIDNFNIESAKASIKNLKDSTKLTGAILKNDLPWLTGAQGERKILMLFVNNNELRGGGGFIGSYAVANFKDNGLKSLNFQTNIYTLDNAFTAKNTVSPPAELNFVNQGKWALRDSNWALDYPETAAKVQEFYQKESGEKVDGVITMDTTLITDLLKITGPIAMPEYNMEITSDNFTDKVQYEVEIGYFQTAAGKAENQPKKILAAMMPKFINKVLDNFSNPERLLPTIATFSKNISQKHLVFQFNNQSFTSHLSEAGIDGKIPETQGDFLMISNTNLGGGKSSQKVEENFDLSVQISDSGVQKSTLEIERTHKGTGDWPDGYNKNLARILLPKGAKIGKTEELKGDFFPLADKRNATETDFYTGEEAGYSKLSFWINTKPQETSKVKIEYSLPTNYDLSHSEFYYKLHLQKQIGSNIDSYTLKINYPKGFVPKNVENYDAKNNQIIIDGKLDRDKDYKIKFIKS